MNLTGTYGPRPSREDAVHLMRAAFERGVTFFDTAQAYGPFLSEDLVGEAVEPVRGRVVIATKFGYEIDPATNRAVGLNSRPEYLKRSVEGSLRRLRVEAIDLLYQHRIDPRVPIEDVAGAVADLIRGGKVRYFGLSEAGAATIRRAHAVQPLAAVTNEYSVWTRDPEGEVIPVCEELGIGLSPWSPTGEGFLTGTVTDTTRLDPKTDIRAAYHFPRFTPDALRANRPLVDLLRSVGRRHDATPVQVALAWLLARKPWIVPVFGTTRLDHLEEDLGASGLHLTDADMTEIQAGFSRIGVQGKRFPPEVLSLSDVGAVLGTSSRDGHGKSPLPQASPR
jgi:aryl-alcohol dehydrogenase-like predicted oxidoreductase